MWEKETIVAPATVNGESAVAILRVSGPAVPNLIESIFGRLPRPRESTLGTYKALDGKALDSLLFVYFKEGHSYTGEATLELMPHGNPWLVRHILDDLIARGCTTAQPGAFTRQAFENGRLDLTQAEAVMQLIQARSDRALEAARRQLGGSVGNAIQKLVDQLLAATAQVEATIDFPEEDLPENPTSPTLGILHGILREMEYLIATRPYAALLHEGVKCVILGEPNAGKSSLLNALIGENRALVSEQPGTTRDYIEERLQIGPFLLRVVDTAGLHETHDSLELQGITRSMEQVEGADILLLVLDRNRPAPTLPNPIGPLLTPDRCLIVENKSDLTRNASLESFLPACPRVSVAALLNEGLHDLRNAVRSMIESGLQIPDSEAVIVSARHANALEKAREALLEGTKKLSLSAPPELVAAYLREALSQLEHILGRIDNERMLDKLFGEFCIGK